MLCSQLLVSLLIVADILAILFQCGGSCIQFFVQLFDVRLGGLLLAGEVRQLFVKCALSFKTELKSGP